MRAMTPLRNEFFFSGLSRQVGRIISELIFLTSSKKLKCYLLQKFEAQRLDMFNSNIIARELGLSDKVQNEHTGANGKPLIPSIKK